MPHTCSIRMDGGIKVVLVPDLEHHQTLKFARDNLVQWAKQMVQEQRVITPVRELVGPRLFGVDRHILDGLWHHSCSLHFWKKALLMIKCFRDSETEVAPEDPSRDLYEPVAQENPDPQHLPCSFIRSQK